MMSVESGPAGSDQIGILPSQHFQQADPTWVHPTSRSDFLGLRKFSSHKRLAVVVHIFYEDLWPEMLQAIRNIQEPYDLFVTLVINQTDHVANAIRAECPDAYILAVDNHGRDILPFLLILKSSVLYRYDLLCKVHTKRSLWHQDGEAWRRDLISGILGDRAMVQSIITAFRENTDLGMVVADKHLYRGREMWIGNRPHLTRFFRHFEMDESAFDLPFAGGSIFWIRPSLLRGIADLPLGFDDFELEPLGADGCLVHSIERMVSLMCYDADMRIEQTSILLSSHVT